MTKRLPSFWRDYAYRLYGQRLLFCLLLALQLFPALYYYAHAGRYPYGGELVYQGISILSWAAIPALLISLFPWSKVRQVLVALALAVYAFLVLFESSSSIHTALSTRIVSL